jgi:uncharacterized membrane protein YeaQ/YmgE (transglycosylase-associated protein family)
MEQVLTLLIVGAVAGWLGSLLMKGRKLALGAYIVLGIIGAFVGDVVFSILGMRATSIIGRIVFATVGAIIVIWLVNQIWKPRPSK